MNRQEEVPTYAVETPGNVGSPKRVGGFLLLFCIWTGLISPLYSLWGTGDLIFSINKSDWSQIVSKMVMAAAFSSVLKLYGSFVSWKVWMKHANAIKAVKTYLVVSLTTNLLTTFWLMNQLFQDRVRGAIEGRDSEFYANVIPMLDIAFVTEILYFAFWYLYFKKSKRVKATFPTAALAIA